MNTVTLVTFIDSVESGDIVGFGASGKFDNSGVWTLVNLLNSVSLVVLVISLILVNIVILLNLVIWRYLYQRNYKMNIRIYLYQENDMNEYSNIFVSKIIQI
jgi:hypothetical protein